MKTRTLMILIGLAALLALLLWRRECGSCNTTPNRIATGSKALPGFDPNAVAQIRIGTEEPVTLNRTADGWTVASLWNHPADFARISDLLRALDQLKVGEVLRGGEQSLHEFGLDPATNDTPALPAVLALLDEGGTEIAQITVGQPRLAPSMDTFAPPDSRYIRVNQGPVLLAAPYLEEVQRRSEDWMERSLVDLPGDSITSVVARLADGKTYGIHRAGDAFAGTGALADKKINAQGAGLWTRALQSLSAQTVLDPASDREALGLGKLDSAEFQTRDGLLARIELGHASENGERPCAITLNWSAPPLPEALGGEERTRAEADQQATADRIAALQRKVSPWIYRVPGSSASQLTLLEAQLIDAAPEPVTNAAPSAATDAPAVP